ncbi:hypothetical protein KOI35_10970 [Actinoplanes bogorensis]|uniref:Uncharacterized protein n=1 Tax=Paractinoplanes bogorensis TaxID=1610840 RepID=A0ABS5YLU0_9ACTN|nr:hypothetical protein [Actinoplanes bogorensis]MBU2664011.1 hypothetical protein [Actinoplanes bogorensis]
MIDHLRTGWPEPMLTGQYAFVTSGGGLAGDLLSGFAGMVSAGLIEPGNPSFLRIAVDGKPLLAVVPGERGPRAVAREPWISLHEHPLPPRTEYRQFARVVGSLFLRRYDMRTRIRMSARELTRPTPVPRMAWDVFDDRLGEVIGQLTNGVGARTVILGPDGRVVARLLQDPDGKSPPRLLTLVAGRQPVAHMTRAGRDTYRVDVSGIAAAGLDPRLVLACAMLQF